MTGRRQLRSRAPILPDMDGLACRSNRRTVELQTGLVSDRQVQSGGHFRLSGDDASDGSVQIERSLARRLLVIWLNFAIIDLKDGPL